MGAGASIAGASAFLSGASQQELCAALGHVRAEDRKRILCALQPEATGAGTDAAAGSDDHLSLAITFEGFCEFLTRICFPVGKHGNHSDRYIYKLQAEAMNEFPYKRGEELKWCDELFGELLTGYDVAGHIREWMRANGHEALSVCELLRNEGSSHVGKANVFFSHAQLKPIEYTLWSLAKVPRTLKDSVKEAPEEIFFWLDYPVLRQCVRDFDLDLIRQTIQTIGCTVAEIDAGKPKDVNDWAKGFNIDYFARTFCIFELFVSVEGNCDLVLMLEDPRAAFQIGKCVIDAAEAQSRDPKAKKMMDDWIERTIGFEKVNAAMYHSLKKQCMRSGFHFDEKFRDAYAAGFYTCDKYYSLDSS